MLALKQTGIASMDNSTTTSYGGFPEALSNGGGWVSSGPENGHEINHGWQKVKHKRRSNKLGPADAAGSLSGVGGAESKVFQALEREAEGRRANRESLLRGAAAGAAATIGASTPAHAQSDSEAEADEQNHHQGGANGPSGNGEIGKIKPKKPKKIRVTVSEAASAIDQFDLAAFLAQISEFFAELPDVQLKRFADYFGRAFNSVTPTHFGWNKILKESSISKAAEIPFCYVSDSVNKTASDWLAARPLDALGDFVIWGLNDVVNDMQRQQGSHKGSKGVSTQVSTKTKVGLLAVLALALRRRPEALLQKAAVVRTSSQFQGQDKLAMLAWAYGQAAQGDLVVGMQLWVQNLLPLACGKNSTPASRDVALKFAESILFVNLKKARLVLQNGASRKGERLVPPAALDSLMRVSFPSDIARTKATERFQGIYPLVKELALYGPHRSKATKLITQQLLPLCLEAASEDVPALANEACAMLIWCLSENADCFKQWGEFHLGKLKGSVKVLSYMCGEWSTIAGQLNPLDNLKNSINILRMKNQEALQNVKGDAKLDMMLKASEKHCKVLQKKLARVGTCLKGLATLIAGVAIAYVFYLLNLYIHLVR